MRVIAAIVLIVISWMSAVSAQTDWAESPGTWTSKSPPTVRSWGMGFSGAGLTGEFTVPENPGSLGLWAMRNEFHFGANWSSSPTLAYGATTYDLSNLYQLAGMRWSPAGQDTAETFSLGLMYHRGHTRWGPHPTPDFFDAPDDSEQELVEDYTTKHEWALGAAIDFGIEIGIGFQWTRYEFEQQWWPGNPQIDGLWPIRRVTWDQTFGLIACGRVNELLGRLLRRDSVLRIGPFTFDMSASYGGGGYSGVHGWMSDGTLSYSGSPLAAIVTAHDRDDDYTSTGWEVTVLGTYAYRWGKRRWSGSWRDVDGSVFSASYHWTTYGHAFHSRGIGRWVARLVSPSRRSLLGWILENSDIYYETAEFDKGGLIPQGFGDITVYECGLRLLDLSELF